jgi:hypothetical protein
MKKNKAERAAATTAPSTTTVETTPVVTVTESKKALGRPADPNSARQQRLQKMADKHKGGFIRLGRPANPESKRQQQLAEIKAKKAAGVVGKKGRPKMSEEAKAEAKAKRDAAYEVWLKNQETLGGSVEAPAAEVPSESAE